jgi:hypothetical protein
MVDGDPGRMKQDHRPKFTTAIDDVLVGDVWLCPGQSKTAGLSGLTP